MSQDLAGGGVRMGFHFFSFRRRNHKRAMSSVVVFTVTSTHPGAMDDDACFRVADEYDNTTVPYIITTETGDYRPPYIRLRLVRLLFQSEQCFSLTTIQPEQCFQLVSAKFQTSERDRT